MKSACAAAIVLCVALAASHAVAATQLKGLGVDETLEKPPILAPALERSRSPTTVPVFVRLIVDSQTVVSTPAGLARLDERLDLYARKKAPVLLTLGNLPAEVPSVDGWGTTLRTLAEHVRGRVFAYQVGDRLESSTPPAHYAYAVKTAAVQVRSVDPTVLVVQASLGPQDAAAWQERLYDEEVAAYIDGVPLTAPETDVFPTDTALRALDNLIDKRDPPATTGVTGLLLPAGAREAAARLIAWSLTHLGDRTTFLTCVAEVDQLANTLRAAAAVSDIYAGELVTLDDQASGLRLSAGGQDVTATVPHRLLYNMTTFATYLVYWTPGSAGALEVSLRLPAAGVPAVRDAVAGTVVKVAEYTRDESSKISTARVDVTAQPLLLDFNFGSEDVYALRADAQGRAQLTVDEIVARYQQAETAQQALVRNYVALARVDLHFQPTVLDSYDVVVENRFFYDPDTTEWEEISFTLNGTRFGRNRPPFPLLQPEKVLSLPLTLRFNRDYVYHLEGTERVGDRPCYVVRFDPIDSKRSLYRGRVWIDSDNFLRLKVQATQTNLVAPVVSNEEVQLFEPVARANDQPLYLLSKLTSHQTVVIAGRNLLVDRNIAFSEFNVNDETFAARRQQAREGDGIMYRDTDKGLRNLVKRGGQRIVSDQVTTTGKALAAGVTIDPSYDYPLPLLGINYANFDFLDKGLQLGFIFAGVLGAGNLQKPNISGTKLDLSFDFYGIAVYGNDQVFHDEGEVTDERLQSRRAIAGANLGYQLSDFQKVTLGAHWQYDWYRSVPDETSPTFVVPVDASTWNPSVAYEYRRGGYSLLGSYNYFHRADWQPWGDGTDYEPSAQTYTKYSLGLSRDFYFGAFHKLRANVAYYGGTNLDRFSMYRFGLFDETRVRGVPSAGIRFSEVGIVRAGYSFNLLNLYRLAAYVDYAEGRTPTQVTWVPTAGVGTELNFPGPKTTLVKVGVGKGFLPEMYKGSGSWVVELMVFKPI